MAFPTSHKAACALLALLSLHQPLSAQTDAGNGIAWSLGYDPASLDPAKVDDGASETIRYLTGGVLLRTNRHTQEAEPSLAEKWLLSRDGRTATFFLRPGLHFSDGSPLTATDVVFSLRRVLAPATGAPVAEEFLSPREVSVESPDATTVIVRLPKRLVEIGHIFDEIAIEPAGRPSEGRVTAGPYRVAEYLRGRYILLARNEHYWKRDPAGNALPYLQSIRLDVLGSAEAEQLRFLRGTYGVLNEPAPEYFNALASRMPQAVHDLGPSLNTEQLWFNQAAGSPLPPYEKQWFQNTAFRVAVSRAIGRADLARLAYAGRATPAYGFISPANHAWYASRFDAPHEDLPAAKTLLAQAGFRRVESGGHATLYDAGGHPVRFSLLTNAGNPARARMATLIQQDLRSLGIDVVVATLDFPALIERLLHTQDYEACLLGLSNVDPDPNSMMNVWLSSSPNHQWNPSEKAPATPWEADMDAAVRAQASTTDKTERLHAINHLQSIVAAEQPFIYLVYPNALYAVSPALAGVDLSVLTPGAVWNIETLHWGKVSVKP